MSNENVPALRGDAAWRAAKDEIEKRNDAARKAGAARRTQESERALARQRALDKHDMENLPTPPEP